MNQTMEHAWPGQLYFSLRKQLEAAGLTGSTKVYYTTRIVLVFLVLAGAMTLALGIAGTLWFIMSACLVAFFAVQAGFIGHDAAHGCIARNRWVSTLVGQTAMSFVLGLSHSYWTRRHNEHHANTNDERADPDVKDAFFSFSEAHAKSRTGFFRFTTRYQDFFLFVLLFFGFFSLRITSWFDLLSRRKQRRLLDSLFLAGHILTFVVLPILFCGFWKGTLFYLTWSALAGFYFGMVFIPNHMGMATIRGESNLDFMTRQILASRNVNAFGILDPLFGGLNYQIEHHLFPSLSRKHLRKAREIVSRFCKEHALSYHEEGIFGTYFSILLFSRRIRLSMRAAKSLPQEI